MSQCCPANAIELEWTEARARVDEYLRAACLANEEQRERIISTVLQRAVAKHVQDPAGNPTALAMHEFFEVTDDWLRTITQSRESASANALVYLFATDATKKWPAAFLSDDVPADFVRRIRECKASPAPDLRVSRMVPQPFHSPLTGIALPTALGQLAKDLSPSVIAKVGAVVWSAFSILSGNRMR